MSLAINDGEVTFENEVIRDFHTYISDAKHFFSLVGKQELTEEFIAAIESEAFAE